MSIRDEFLILLNVVNKPNTYILTLSKPVDDHRYNLELRIVLRYIL